MKCTSCGHEAVFESRYSGSFLCREHFAESVDKRVKQELRKQIRFTEKKGKIAVAISGGKDSSLALFMIHRYYSSWKNVEIVAFTVDEGIKGYREHGLESAVKLADEMGIEHFTLSFKEAFGTTMDQEVANDGSFIPCSRCGPMRRGLMNWASVRVDADYVVLGINLDDYAQSIMMNVVRGDVTRMGRMAPHEDSRDGLVRRAIPLRLIPENEVMLYCILNDIPHDLSWCPYSNRAQRNYFRNIVSEIEDRFPGSRFAMVKFLDGIKPLIKGAAHHDSHTSCERQGKDSICSDCPPGMPENNSIIAGDLNRTA